MSDLISSAVSPFDAIKRIDEHGEYWAGRELMPVMGYLNWREFKDAIERAKIAAANTGADVTRLFGGAPKKSTGGRPAEDVRLTRHAAYLVAMNGDPRKPEIAAAQTYFAIKTREAETSKTPAELTRAEILRMALDAEERRLDLEAKTIKQAAEIKVLTPKANYVDSFVSPIHDATTKGTRWSHSKGRVVQEYSWHAYATHADWFTERDQPEAGRLHNGQLRTTLYVTPVGKVKVTELLHRTLPGGAV